jgi:hypothetical protein
MSVSRLIFLSKLATTQVCSEGAGHSGETTDRTEEECHQRQEKAELREASTQYAPGNEEKERRMEK